MSERKESYLLNEYLFQRQSPARYRPSSSTIIYERNNEGVPRNAATASFAGFMPVGGTAAPSIPIDNGAVNQRRRRSNYLLRQRSSSWLVFMASKVNAHHAYRGGMQAQRRGSLRGRVCSDRFLRDKDVAGSRYAFCNEGRVVLWCLFKFGNRNMSWNSFFDNPNVSIYGRHRQPLIGMWKAFEWNAFIEHDNSDIKTIECCYLGIN